MGYKLIGFYEDIKDNVSKETLDKYVLFYGFMAGYQEFSFKIIDDNEKFIYNRFRNTKEDFKVLDTVYNQVFKEKISRKERLLEIAKFDLEKIDISELSEKFDVSETTIRKDIREVFGIQNMRIEKYLKLQKLRKLLEQPISTADISEKLNISKDTARKYLKEINSNQ